MLAFRPQSFYQPTAALQPRPIYTFVNAEAATVVAAFDVEPDDTRKALIDTLVGALKAPGIWALFDCLYIMAAHTAASARVNWKNPGTFDLTPVNAPSFTVDRGFTGNGTSSYHGTGFIPSSAGGVYALNDSHFGVWSRSNLDEASVAIGARDASNVNQAMLTIRNSNQAVYRINQNVNPSAVSNDSSGDFVVRRTASNAVAVYRNATSFATATSVSTGRPQFEFFVGALNTGGVASLFSAYEIAAGSIGKSLSVQNITDRNAALQTYMTGVGA